jgi:tetratricopeptide (TPR) repeat protein
MKQLSIFIVFIFCGKMIFAQQENAPKTYALVIGVAKYLDPEIPQLQFANRDATIFAEFLRSKAGGSVPKENIRLLVDETATSGAVTNAIYWLKEICNKGDKVYIYFSGHGDLENITMYNNGFLICYDSPPFNYVNLALSINYLNDIANTISIKKQAHVIMITDACHSGKMTEKVFKGNFLAGNQLRTVKNNEIRITSSAADQLSNEKADWGGGRGVFSYYLINGLKGLAVRSNADKITLDDIRVYLDSSLKNDLVLKQDSTIQTPVVNGKGNFILSQIDTTALITAKKEVTQDTLMHRMMMVMAAAPEETTPDQYFYNLLKQYRIEGITDSFSLNEVPAETIPFVLIDSLIKQDYNESGKTKLQELKQTLLANKETLKEFKNTLATAFDEAGQRVITQYLRGDAAELEKRRYYNVGNNSYNVYPRMFEVALKLVSPDNIYYYNNLKVKLHYFSGVNARLKITVESDKDKRKQWIEAALAEQKKALKLEQYAPYIYNEIGILYSYKNDFLKAAANFRNAANRAPNWAIPYSNLADLYTANNQLEKARLYIDTAKSLQPDYQDIYNSFGLIYEKKKSLLQAEEAFHKSIKLNSLNYLPFERLGFLYMNTNKYAVADSFLFEAASRKKGYFFDEQNNPRHMRLPKVTNIPGIESITDPRLVAPNDVAGHFALGYQALRDFDRVAAEDEFRKVIELDKKNPLAYHYLGRTLFEQKRWQECELILKLAMDHYMEYPSWLRYSDSLLARSALDFFTDLGIDSCFRYGYYNQQEDYLMLAQLYQNWGHYGEAETYYLKFIESDSAYFPGYIQLARLYENTGRYNEAEMLLNNYYIKYQKGMAEILNFYKRITQQFPENGEWFLKAGLFQFAFAQKEPGRYWDDTKIIDPFTGEISYAYLQKSAYKIPDPILPRLIPYGTVIKHIDPKVRLMPFTDGIYFLKKSLRTLAFDEKLLAGINGKIGDLYDWQGLPDSAVYFFQASIDLNADDAGIRNRMVETLLKTYRFTEALIQLDSLSNRNELNFAKELMLVKYKIQDGQIKEAEKILGEAEKINPSFNLELALLKATLAEKNGNIKQALEIYTGIYQMNKNDSINLYNMARQYALLGNKTEAWKWLEMAMQQGFNYRNVLQYDPALKNLRKQGASHPRFLDLKAKEYFSSDFTRWNEMFTGLTENPASSFK